MEHVDRWIVSKFNLDESKPYPLEIPGHRREYLGELFAELGYTEGVEVGVYRGDFSLALVSVNPKLHLSLVDPWELYDDYREDFIGVNQAEVDQNLEIAKEKLKGFNVTFIRKKSMDAVVDFKDESLDFVYIDGHHGVSYVINDLEWWGRKVKKNGMICGHDYLHIKPDLRKFNPNFRVVEAVNAYIQAYDIHRWFIMGRGRDERNRSFVIPKRHAHSNVRE